MKTSSDKEKEEEQNQLRMENEVKKIKLSLEHGMNFSTPSGQNEIDLPPEIESEFLDHVQRFEDAWANCKTTPLYDFIGKPAFRKVADVPDKDISDELTRLLDLLRKKHIEVDTICEVEDRELYRFITEELFVHEKDDMMLPGMMTHYIYEEFHPNHEYDITEHCKDFVNALFNKKKEFNAEFLPLSINLEIKGKKYDVKKGVEKLEYFRDAYKTFKVRHFKILSISFTAKKAKMEFEINYTGDMEGSNHKIPFLGKGSFGLINKYDYWVICKIDMPGI
jgi:hypothetical protein